MSLNRLPAALQIRDPSSQLPCLVFSAVGIVLLTMTPDCRGSYLLIVGKVQVKVDAVPH